MSESLHLVQCNHDCDEGLLRYMMTNRSRVVLYTGVTNGLERRLWFHQNVSPRSFTRKYKADRLVCYERFDRARDAISREEEIKGWRREKENDLVRTLNPMWKTWGKSYSRIVGEVPRRLRGSG